MTKKAKIAIFATIGLAALGLPLLLSAKNKTAKILPGGNSISPGGNQITQPGWGTPPINPDENKSGGGLFSFIDDLFPKIFGNNEGGNKPTIPLPGGVNIPLPLPPAKPPVITPTNYPTNTNVVIVPPNQTSPVGSYKFNPSCFVTHPYVPISPMVAAVARWETLSDVPEYIPHDCLIKA